MSSVAAAVGASRLDFRDFSGGLNIRDSAVAQAPNFFSDGTVNINIVNYGRGFARRGAAVDASGTIAVAPANPTISSRLFYSAALNLFLFQVDNAVYKANTSGGSWTNILTPGDNNGVDFADFNGVVVMCNGTGGIWTYNGTTVTNRSTVAKCGALAVWQNKVWGISVEAGKRTTVYWSNAGDATTWTTGTDVQQIREKDDNNLTTIFGGQTLLVFKRDSAYRITDSTTGAYQTIDWKNGAGLGLDGYAEPQTVAGTNDGDVVIINQQGLYRGNGIGAFKKVSSLVPDLAPEFRYSVISVVNNKVLVGMIDNSNAVGHEYWEYDTETHWILRHTLKAVSGTDPPKLLGMTTFLPSTTFSSKKIFGLTRDGSANTSSVTLSSMVDRTNLSTSSDVTNTYAARAIGAYQEPNNGLRTRMHRFSAWGRSADTSSGFPFVGFNYQDETNTVQTKSTQLGQESSETTEHRFTIRPYTLARAFAFDVNDTSSTTPIDWSISRFLMEFFDVET